jgi:hypothetical protein
MAWQCISPEVTAKGPRQWMGTNDAILWNDSEKDADVRSESEEDEGTDCDNGGSNINW